MKLECEVREVKSSGPRLTVRLTATPLKDESRYVDIWHEVELPNTATARRAYTVGRKVTIELNVK